MENWVCLSFLRMGTERSGIKRGLQSKPFPLSQVHIQRVLSERCCIGVTDLMGCKISIVRNRRLVFV